MAKAMKAIENLKKNKVLVSALCTISKYNINELEDIVQMVENMGIGISFSIPVLFPRGQMCKLR